MSLSIGQRIGSYELLDYLDSSAQRIAYRAWNHDQQRIEQLHILPEGVEETSERSARFFRESRILATLRHPNILTCHGVIELGGRLAIAMEAIEAVTLADRLDLGPFPIEEAVAIGKQLLGAMETAHAAGVVHREICPDNVLITPDREVKLTGFAAAKSITDPNVTRAGTVFGQTSYAAPELFEGHGGLDPRTDIYALGCLLYALLTGKPPFLKKSEYELTLAHMQEPPQPPSRRVADIPAWLDEAVLKALAKNPWKRYQSAGEFLSALVPGGDTIPPAPSAEESTAPPTPVAPVEAAPEGVISAQDADLIVPFAATESPKAAEASPAYIAIAVGVALILAALWLLARGGASAP